MNPSNILQYAITDACTSRRLESEFRDFSYHLSYIACCSMSPPLFWAMSSTKKTPMLKGIGNVNAKKWQSHVHGRNPFHPKFQNYQLKGDNRRVARVSHSGTCVFLCRNRDDPLVLETYTIKYGSNSILYKCILEQHIIEFTAIFSSSFILPFHFYVLWGCYQPHHG